MKTSRALPLILLSVIVLVTQAGNIFSSNVNNENDSSGNYGNSASKPARFLSNNESGMSAATLSRIDSIVLNGIRNKAFPGCQVCVLRKGKTVYDKCFGYYTYESKQKVTPSTLYDLASLTKTTGTLLAIMKLYDEKKLKMTDKASDYLPFLIGTDKENITVKELLFHETGLPGSLPFHQLVVEKKVAAPDVASTGDNTNYVRINSSAIRYKAGLVSKIPSPEFCLQVSDSLYLRNSTHQLAMKMIADTRLRSKTYLYSCVNFIVLKEIAETISGVPMDEFLDKNFYRPMKLSCLAYLPLRTHRKEEVAPTLRKDILRNGQIQGFVHDPAAAYLGGVSGNAGLFASADDVAKVYQMLLNNGELNGKRYLSAETCRLFTTTVSLSGRRGLGFDKPVPSKPTLSPCCPSAPRAVYGHTGYTGTCCWVDPVNDLVYVFLSNRTYPVDGINKLARMGIRKKIQETIYQAMR